MKKFSYILQILVVFFLTLNCAKPNKEPILLAQNAPEIQMDNSPQNAGNRCVKTQKGNAINWSDHQNLAWVDFKAKEKGTPGFAVGTVSSNFGYLIPKNNKEQLKGSIYVRFYCNESWVNPSFNNERILGQVLAHEQLHFNIAELYGRKFYKAIQELKAKGKFNKETLRATYRSLQTEFDDYQDQYDDETGHSTNGDRQRYWFKKMDKDLQDLDAYKNYTQF